MKDPGTENTRFGFTWNNLAVERICSNKRGGSFLFIGTDRETMEIRVTPGGRISVHSHEKNKMGRKTLEKDT
jgi:hypothetical protein